MLDTFLYWSLWFPSLLLERSGAKLSHRSAERFLRVLSEIPTSKKLIETSPKRETSSWDSQAAGKRISTTAPAAKSRARLSQVRTLHLTFPSQLRLREKQERKGRAKRKSEKARKTASPKSSEISEKPLEGRQKAGAVCLTWEIHASSLSAHNG